MARVSIQHPDVVQLVKDKLVPLFYLCGSVNALAGALNSTIGGSGKKIYPNQLHRILSQDVNQFVNNSTLEQIRAACSELVVESHDEKREKFFEEASVLRSRAPDVGHAMKSVIKEMRVPAAIAKNLLGYEVEETARLAAEGHEFDVKKRPALLMDTPDWSFQDTACARCLQDLGIDPNEKIGLVIPTGGGKTRVALRIALSFLSKHPKDQTVVWLTHQNNLQTQAQNELKSMLNEGGFDLPDDAAKLLAQRVEFLMLSKINSRLGGDNPPIALLIVDEAHHAAAPSYESIFEAPVALNGLFLTATPNRTDDLPIGIDRISYSVTYSELEQHGVILRPIFEDFPVNDFDWSAESVDDLANYIIDRAETEFTKTLVLAPRVDRVEEFYDALQNALDARVGHILTSDDIGYIHGSRNSTGETNEEFLANFTANPRAVIVSAKLLLEGFNDPSINAVVVTNPSKSLIQVMQACGRCVRYAPGKTSAYFVQARQDDLAYHFDHRWLYQEISDYLRPTLEDVEYSSINDLRAKMEQLLGAHNCSQAASQQVLQSLLALKSGSTCRLLLSGLPFIGERDDFSEAATWNPILEIAENSLEFRWIFNDFCERGAEDSDPTDLMRMYAKKFGFHAGTDELDMWRTYNNMLISMCMASREIYQNIEYSGRPFHRQGSTSWLKYVTFVYVPELPLRLQEFLTNCHNKEEVMEQYLAETESYSSVIKQPLPLGEWESYLLTHDAHNRFQGLVHRLRVELKKIDPSEQFSELASILANASGIEGLPMHLLHRIDGFLPAHLDDERVLKFADMD